MPEMLQDLEAQRTRILHQFANLGDFRPGSICAITRRCGKPSCHCAKSNDAGHDPQVRLTHKAGGRTVAETISSPAALRKANAEIVEFQRFRELSADLTGVNEKICRLRPVEAASAHWTAEEKKRLLRSIGSSHGR
jgi:hypothetical protein